MFDRAEKTHRRSGRLLDRLRVGRHQSRDADRPADLGLVGLVIATQEHGHWLAVAQVDQQLGRGRFLDLQELADVADRPLARRVHRLEWRRGEVGLRRHRVVGADLCPLLVGRVAAGGALDDPVLAGRAGDHEFVRGVAADRAALGLDDHVRKAAAVVDPAVGLVHGVVALVELGDVGVEAVRVLHHELASPDDAEPRPGLVAELGLDLVHRDRQLLVRVDQVAYQVGDHLLVGRAQAHLVAAANGQLHQQVAVGLVPARFLPDLDRLQGRHQQLDGPGGVHLLAERSGWPCAAPAGPGADTCTPPRQAGGSCPPGARGYGWEPRHRPGFP